MATWVTETCRRYTVCVTYFHTCMLIRWFYITSNFVRSDIFTVLKQIIVTTYFSQKHDPLHKCIAMRFGNAAVLVML